MLFLKGFKWSIHVVVLERNVLLGHIHLILNIFFKFFMAFFQKNLCQILKNVIIAQHI